MWKWLDGTKCAVLLPLVVSEMRFEAIAVLYAVRPFSSLYISVFMTPYVSRTFTPVTVDVRFPGASYGERDPYSPY